MHVRLTATLCPNTVSLKETDHEKVITYGLIQVYCNITFVFLSVFNCFYGEYVAMTSRSVTNSRVFIARAS